jgi:hypothetical protein
MKGLLIFSEFRTLRNKCTADGERTGGFMNMKRNTRFLRAAALGAALLLAAVIGCKNESGGETGSNTLPSTDGLLTITGIDGVEGKYAFVDGHFGSGEQAQSLLGAETVDKNSGIATGVEIKGRKALIPIYASTYINEGETVSFIFDNYSGNETVQLFVFILINILLVFLIRERRFMYKILAK